MWYLVLVMIIIIMILEKIIDNRNISPTPQDALKNINYNDKYVKKEYLLTQTELKFYKLLKPITDELNLIICPQVPLYEIVKNIDYKDFNKIASKSIDFVITEPNLKIKLCIELDDYTHKQIKRIERDKFIEKLFKDLNIKILRIPVQNFYNLNELNVKIKESL